MRDVRVLGVVLVDDLTDEFFEAVLERDQTGNRPYSSATIAMWKWSRCMSRISLATGLFSGTTLTVRTSDDRTAAPWPDRTAFMRSFA